jgi:hypothetical protein
MHAIIYFLWFKDLSNVKISREIDFIYGKLSLGSGPSETGRIFSPRVTTVSKSGSGPIILAQSNMWTGFARY